MTDWYRMDPDARHARPRPPVATPPPALAAAWRRVRGAWCLPGQQAQFMPALAGFGPGEPTWTAGSRPVRDPWVMHSAVVDPSRTWSGSAPSVFGQADGVGAPTDLDTGIDADLDADLDPEDGVDVDHREVWRLVAAAQAGDGEAFGALYDRYVDTVYRFLYYRLNDRALAEDFTSETFLRALRRISGVTYQGRDIGAWLITIARNIVLDHVKSARHRLEITTAEMLDGDDREPSPESTVLDSLRSEQLMAAVARLGDEQRECVTLRFIQGLSVSETAEAMGKNDGAVKALQHRAVRKLAELVGDELR